MQKWEYRREFWHDMGGDDAGQMLKKLGDEGWEFVSFGWVEGSEMYLLVFKRPVETDADR